MKLAQFEVFDFQCVRSSNPVRVGDITCLLGKNEAGKTALLKALYRTNPWVDRDGAFDVMEDYPRADVEEYQHRIETGEIQPETVVRAEFQAERDDLKEIEASFGDSALVTNTVVLSKSYDNKSSFEVEVDEQAALRHFAEHAPLPDELKQALADCENFTEAADQVQQRTLAEEHRKAGEALRSIKEQGFGQYLYSTFLRPRIPKFVYFDEYYQLRGHENLEALKQRVDRGDLRSSDHAMLGLLGMARLQIDQLLNPRGTQLLISKLEGAGMTISKQTARYWSQNQMLQVKFDVRPAHPADPGGADGGTILWASVFDPNRFHSTLLGTRSRGFIWFFSFLAWYSQLRNSEQPVILLLDEPGQSLHPRAQADLLRFLDEQLGPHHQLLYSTHSPFMIDARYPERLRFVEDRSSIDSIHAAAETQGTKVTEDRAQASAETLVPLETASQEPPIPAPITSTSPNQAQCQLLVEDVADLFYLRAMSLVLADQGAGMNDEWVIIPVGGIEQIPTYISQVNQGPDAVIALLLSPREQDQEIFNAFLGKRLLAEDNIRTMSDFANLREVAIEDLFDPVFYANLVNAAYRGYIAQPVAATELNDFDSVRLRDRLRAYFSRHPLQGGIQFNHRRPARLFADNASKLQGEFSQQTKDGFATLFDWLNRLGAAPHPQVLVRSA